ncbi:uncharacterized protein TNCV_2845401 [Trichonephila clavipes]|nr:uncharacterized protein TNCV_2845401 [Trichonephila clavipes]
MTIFSVRHLQGSRFLGLIQDNEARGKIWETLLHSPLPLILPGQDFSAVLRTLTSHSFLQQHLHLIGVKDTQTLPSVSLWRGYECYSPDSLCFPADRGFNFSSDKFTAKVGLYWAARREIAYTAHSLA